MRWLRYQVVLWLARWHAHASNRAWRRKGFTDRAAWCGPVHRWQRCADRLHELDRSRWLRDCDRETSRLEAFTSYKVGGRG